MICRLSVGGVFLIVALSGCGSGKTPTATPTPTPAPTPTPSGPPSITSVSPATPTVSAATQTLTITGTNFQAGMVLTVTAPRFFFVNGPFQFQSLTATSVQVANLTLPGIGAYTFQLTSPSGEKSNVFNASTQFRTSGTTWIPEGVRLTEAQNNPPGGGIANVMANQLRDGRWRLVYNGGQSVISPDGLAWTLENPSRGLPRVDANGTSIVATLPRLLKLANGQLRAYYGSGHTNSVGILSAISSDEGLTWTPESGVRIPIAATGQTLPVAFLSGLSVVPRREGGWRGYFSNQVPGIGSAPQFIRSATSTDLLNWTLEPDARVGPGSQLTGIALHVKAIANSDGSTTLFYWRNSPGLGIYTATSTDGLTFTRETLLESLGVGGDPDVVAVGGGYRIYYNWGDDTGGAIYSALNPTGAVATTTIVRNQLNDAAGAAADRNDPQRIRALTD